MEPLRDVYLKRVLAYLEMFLEIDNARVNKKRLNNSFKKKIVQKKMLLVSVIVLVKIF